METKRLSFFVHCQARWLTEKHTFNLVSSRLQICHFDPSICYKFSSLSTELAIPMGFTTACGVLRGSARPSCGAHINLGSFYLIGTPVALTLCFVYKFEFVGLWLGMLAAQVSCLIFMLSVLVRTHWIVEAERDMELTGEPQQIHILCQEKEQCICRTLYIPYGETSVQPLLTVVSF
ncbi:hypothetical protein SUGI_0301430 [Cryptomeria japonica]|nr:hypothetical protein SUGI_0301430 [Cryptomeria japonica]